ncbi:hypothetical protein QYB59_000004 [Clostridium perfringens]|nr:hypothetical protein [Clostridium perfringens]
MKNIKFKKKILFFFGLAPLNEEIDLNFNFKTRTIIFLIFFISLYVLNQYYLDFFINSTNLLLRVILLFIYLYAMVEILYLITIKQYKKSKE